MAYPAFEFISPDEYLNIEIRADKKHEYFDGRMYAMSGASFDHNYIVSTLASKIGTYLDGKDCDVMIADLRVTTPQLDSFMYPDLTILCEEIKSKENTFDTLTNPTAIIEVMSPSTKGYDMAFKFHYYKQILSLKEYILVDSTKYFVQVHRRQNDVLWTEAINTEDINSSLTIGTIDMQLPLADIYRKVSFANDHK